MVSTSRTMAVDVVVVGAGTAGANVALQFARRGRHVALVEHRALSAAGARWDNGIVPWHFERSGLDFPEPSEGRPKSTSTTVMVGPTGTSFRVTDSPVRGSDMRALVASLQGEALTLGVQAFQDARDVTVRRRHGRVVGVDALVDGSTICFESTLVVDASGRKGVVREQVPELRAWCPPVGPAGTCSAAQYEHRVVDRDGARRFLHHHGAAPGDTVTFLGFAGGFSALGIGVSPDLSSVGVLTGTTGERLWGTGTSIMSLTRSQHRWIGEPIFGGAGLIPLRRPYARFSAPGVALVGDAACHMFPAHGSGIGISLVAGTMLAEAAAGLDDCGSTDALWRFQSSFQREHGGTLAGFDLVRRMSTSIGSEGVAAMFDAGLVREESTRAGLEQRWWTPPPSQLPELAARLVRRPGLAAAVLPTLSRSASAHAVYARYPDEPDERAFDQWNTTQERVLGRAAI